MKIVIVHIITGTAMMTASRVRFTDGRAQQRRAVVALGHRVSDYVGNVRDRGGACHRLAVIRSMRDGEHCKHDRRSDKPQACHHHDRDERVSGAKRQQLIAFSDAALARRRAERWRRPREQFHRRWGLYRQRTALLQARYARPQHDDSGGNAPAYAEGFHKIENGPPWLILCNRVAVARVISRSEPIKTGPPLARRPPAHALRFKPPSTFSGGRTTFWHCL
jgi:hypothetical protein